MRVSVKKLIGRAYLNLLGWRSLGGAPRLRKYVLVAAPHTSNWDFPLLLAFSWVHDVRVSWLGKHTLFRGPMGWFFRATGGIPVDRRAAQGVVASVAAAFRDADRLIVAISPEGSRSHREHWKSGFYHVARTANVPIVLGVLDYGRREGGFGPVIEPSGDVHADMDRIREFYADKQGKRPAQFGPVRLREEAEAAATKA
jgi:1-acyl-sn-glycerol-3-phosphate acyltransferase